LALLPINCKGLYQATVSPAIRTMLQGPGLTAAPPLARAPAPVSERQLPGYRARLAATHRAAGTGGRATAGSRRLK